MVHAETIGQYTGLTDKNGTKIFEGDIVKGITEMFSPYHPNGAVIYDEGQYIIKFGNRDDDFEPLCGWYGDIKVIGNIHDNPELLEVEK